MRECIDCKTDISHRGNRTNRCEFCQERHRSEYNRKYQRNNGWDDKSMLRLGGLGDSKQPWWARNRGGNYPKTLTGNWWYDPITGTPTDKYTIERDESLFELGKKIWFDDEGRDAEPPVFTDNLNKYKKFDYQKNINKEGIIKSIKKAVANYQRYTKPLNVRPFTQTI